VSWWEKLPRKLKKSAKGRGRLDRHSRADDFPPEDKQNLNVPSQRSWYLSKGLRTQAARTLFKKYGARDCHSTRQTKKTGAKNLKPRKEGTGSSKEAEKWGSQEIFGKAKPKFVRAREQLERGRTHQVTTGEKLLLVPNGR